MIDPLSQQWHPSISEKQAAIINDRSHPYKLVDGPRKASKTIGALHAWMFHAWTCRMPRLSMCGRTLTDNFDGGAWSDLHNIIIPEWIAGGFGFKYVTEPKLDALTHKLYCEITNLHGKICRIQLDSVTNEKDVERIFKGKRFSSIYIPELSNFKNRSTFDIIEEALRMKGPEGDLLPEEHLFIGDTNPAKEGEDSWIYQFFYEFRLADEEVLMEHFTETTLPMEKRLVQLEALKKMQAKMSVHHFTIDDNIFLSQEVKDAQFAKYAHDPDLLARFYYGLWRKASGNSIFTEVFRPLIHVVGDPPDSKKAEPEIMLPEETCSELGTTWDLGSINKSSQLMEVYYRDEIIKAPPGGKDIIKSVPCFKVLDESITIGEPMPLEEHVMEMLEKMDFWESLVGHPVPWFHVSDLSSFERYEHMSDSYEYKEVYRYSDGRIELQRGPVKKRGSVSQRTQLVKKLFFQDRLFISALAVRTLEMVRNLQKGRINAIDPGSIYKHAFDSLTYFICKICYAELESDIDRMTSKKPVASGIVRVKL